MQTLSVQLAQLVFFGWCSSMLLIAFVVLCAITGYVLLRLSSGRYVSDVERTSVRAIGWTLMTLWLTLAAGLVLLAAWSFIGEADKRPEQTRVAA
jgi:hypothetical protein